MTRRQLLAAAAAAPAAMPAEKMPFPVIDTHIHLFDIDRPQGVPWPPKNNEKLYKTAMPPRYRKLAEPFGVTGAIYVECSPWLEDNQWVLDVADKDPIMVGVIGDLEPGKPGFGKQLERFHKNPLYRGIRYGTLWGRDIHAESKKPDFIADLKLLAQAGLTMDSATASPALIRTLLRITDQVPALRVVIDHLPQMQPPAAPAALKEYESDLREIGRRKQVFVKISEVLRRVDGRIPSEVAFYKPRLDAIVDAFGEDRVLFGSDWPNSDNWAEYPAVFAIVRDYFMARGRVPAEKYFWKNSVQAYHWVKR